MSFIVVESNSNFIKIDLGAYTYPELNYHSPMILNKALLQEAYILGDGVMIHTKGRNNHSLLLACAGYEAYNDKIPYLIVESINGEQPLNKEDLLNKIYNI